MNYQALKLEAVTSKLMLTNEGIYRSFNIWWLLVGYLSLYGFVFFKLPAIAVSGFFHALMVLAFFISVVKSPQSAKRDPAWYLIATAIVISLFIYVWSNLFFPEYAEVYPSTGKLLSLCQFFLIAWWLGGQTRNVLLLLSTALVGFVIWTLMHGVWTEFAAGIAGRRAFFGMNNPQHTAIYFAIAFMGWVLFIRRIVGTGTGGRKVIRALLWVAGIAFLGMGCIVTQTRAAWLGVAAALLVVVLFMLLYRTCSIRHVITGFLIAIVLSIALIYPMSDHIAGRLGNEIEVMHQLLEGDAKKVPYSSIGIRVHTWLEAWKWIKQRPITGWGYEVRGKVFSESTVLPDWVIRNYGHFHNSYIEILLSYGLIGIFFLITLYSVIVRQTWRAWRSGRMPTDVFLFGLAFFIFWILVNFTESYLIGRIGVYFTGLIGGCLYTFSLSEKLRIKSHAIQ